MESNQKRFTVGLPQPKSTLCKMRLLQLGTQMNAHLIIIRSIVTIIIWSWSNRHVTSCRLLSDSQMNCTIALQQITMSKYKTNDEIDHQWSNGFRNKKSVMLK